MADFNEKKYLDLTGLGLYDEKIKAYIGTELAAGDAQALKDAKDYADGLAGNYDAAGAAATVQSNLDKEIARAKAAEEAAQAKAEEGVANAATAQAAAEAAQAAADAAQGEVDALEVLVGTLPADSGVASVVAYVDKKTTGIATDAALTELQGKVTQAEADIDAIEADYLKAADKTELEGKITAEADARVAADEAIDERLVEVEAFFKLAEGEQLDAALDTLVELQTYLSAEGAVADQMLLDIAANKTAIEKEVTDRGTAISGVETAYKAADEAQVARIEALEAKFTGDDSVADQIADAVQAEADLRVAADDAIKGRLDALELIDHSHANQAELDLIASGDKAKWDAAEAKAHVHANAAELDKFVDGDKAKLDSALQAADIATGSANGAIAVKGVDVAVKGLGSAAYTEASAYEVAGAAAAAESAAKTYTDTEVAALHDSFVAITTTEINGLFA